MMAEIKEFDYRGTTVCFTVDGWVNATRMAKPFGKLPSDWLRLKSTKDYMHSLGIRYGNSHNGISLWCRIEQGGNDQGTWLHPKLAIRFAQWLNSMFAVWVDERIEELLKTGTTSIHPKIDISDSGIVGLLRAAAEEIERLKPKADAHDRIAVSEGSVCLTDAAKILKVKPHRFTAELRDDGILFKRNGANVPYAKYLEAKYFDVVVTVKIVGDKERSFEQTRVTPLGLSWLAKRDCGTGKVR